MAQPLTLPGYVAEHNITHVVFDMDATLLLVHFPWDEGWGDPIRDPLRALDPEPWELWATKRRTADMQNAYVEKFGDVALKIIMDYTVDFENRHRGFTKNEALQNDVRALGANIKKYAWSSNTRAVVEYALRESNLDGEFETLVTRDDVRYLKPNTQGFEEHIYDPSVPRDKYLMVGDSIFDREAAEAAGIGFYHIDYFAGQ
jgi:HAD superfamily hydrolase (TIGR01549 family)